MGLGKSYTTLWLTSSSIWYSAHSPFLCIFMFHIFYEISFYFTTFLFCIIYTSRQENNFFIEIYIHLYIHLFIIGMCDYDLS